MRIAIVGSGMAGPACAEELTPAAWPSAGSDSYVGVPAMNAPVRLMANGQPVQWQRWARRSKNLVVSGDWFSTRVKLSMWISPSGQRPPSRRQICSHPWRRISRLG